MYLVPLTVREGVYHLGIYIRIRKAGALSNEILPDWEANALLNETVEHLKSNGFSARIKR